MLRMAARVAESLGETYAVHVPAPGAPPPAPEVLMRIRVQIDELGSICEKLQVARYWDTPAPRTPALTLTPAGRQALPSDPHPQRSLHNLYLIIA
eukprot:3903175-Prymnesium_polylepis.1